jgi:hypothetical protein
MRRPQHGSVARERRLPEIADLDAPALLALVWRDTDAPALREFVGQLPRGVRVTSGPAHGPCRTPNPNGTLWS